MKTIPFFLLLVRRGCALGSQAGTFINVSLTVLGGGDPVHSPNESPPVPPFDLTNTGMGNDGNEGNDFSEHILVRTIRVFFPHEKQLLVLSPVLFEDG